MPHIEGILETALYVQDVGEVSAWYREVFGFDLLYRDDRLIALAVAPRAVLLIFKKGASLEGVHTPDGFIPDHDGGGRRTSRFP